MGSPCPAHRAYTCKKWPIFHALPWPTSKRKQGVQNSLERFRSEQTLVRRELCLVPLQNQNPNPVALQWLVWCLAF